MAPQGKAFTTEGTEDAENPGLARIFSLNHSASYSDQSTFVFPISLNVLD
jgi:hypothetical protein